MPTFSAAIEPPSRGYQAIVAHAPQSPLLTIAICSIASRQRLLNQLLDHLWQQVSGRDDLLASVEVVCDSRASLTTGDKRAALLVRARGSFVAFVDDDDWVADDYIARLVATIRRDPSVDCVSLRGVALIDGHSPMPFDNTIGASRGDRHPNSPNHLNPVRIDLARAAGFPSVTVGEDRAYADRLRPMLHREADSGVAPLYFYRSVTSKPPVVRVAGFLKVRNEILREGNLYRVLQLLDQTCDCGVICDDASFDGTREYLQRWVAQRPDWRLLLVPAVEQNLRKELFWKQRMLALVHELSPHWIFWVDGDEALDAVGILGLRQWIESIHAAPQRAWRFHYTQLWQNEGWARTDGGFDDGWFVKLWRYSPDLSMDVVDRTHHQQFPKQIDANAAGNAPFEFIHWGNVGKNLQWKAHQYADGSGGVDRHIGFGHSPNESMATGVDYDQSSWSEPNPTYRQIPGTVKPRPSPLSIDSIRRIRSMGCLRALERWFTVVVPTYNRADTLPRALDSLLAQKYENWVAVVVDDGSTDQTTAVMRRYQDIDPRIFYARYADNRGGVAVNEAGMRMACELTEYWTRLGSDDWFAPNKLMLDALALSQHEAVYGPFRVVRGGVHAEACSPPEAAGDLRQRMVKNHEFGASWANCAARTSLLRQVRDRYGSFCDPRLRNMEDYLFNIRAASLLPIGWVWRGMVDGQVVIGPSAAMAGRNWEPDGFWNCVTTGASGNTQQYAADQSLTQEILRAEIQ